MGYNARWIRPALLANGLTALAFSANHALASAPHVSKGSGTGQLYARIAQLILWSPILLRSAWADATLTDSTSTIRHCNVLLVSTAHTLTRQHSNARIAQRTVRTATLTNHISLALQALILCLSTSGLTIKDNISAWISKGTWLFPSEETREVVVVQLKTWQLALKYA